MCPCTFLSILPMDGHKKSWKAHMGTFQLFFQLYYVIILSHLCPNYILGQYLRERNVAENVPLSYCQSC